MMRILLCAALLCTAASALAEVTYKINFSMTVDGTEHNDDDPHWGVDISAGGLQKRYQTHTKKGQKVSFPELRITFRRRIAKIKIFLKVWENDPYGFGVASIDNWKELYAKQRKLYAIPGQYSSSFKNNFGEKVTLSWTIESEKAKIEIAESIQEAGQKLTIMPSLLRQIQELSSDPKWHKEVSINGWNIPQHFIEDIVVEANRTSTMFRIERINRAHYIVHPQYLFLDAPGKIIWQSPSAGKIELFVAEKFPKPAIKALTENSSRLSDPVLSLYHSSDRKILRGIYLLGSLQKLDRIPQDPGKTVEAPLVIHEARLSDDDSQKFPPLMFEVKEGLATLGYIEGRRFKKSGDHFICLLQLPQGDYFERYRWNHVIRPVKSSHPLWNISYNSQQKLFEIHFVSQIDYAIRSERGVESIPLEKLSLTRQQVLAAVFIDGKVPIEYGFSRRNQVSPRIEGAKIIFDLSESPSLQAVIGILYPGDDEVKPAAGWQIKELQTTLDTEATLPLQSLHDLFHQQRISSLTLLPPFEKIEFTPVAIALSPELLEPHKNQSFYPFSAETSYQILSFSQEQFDHFFPALVLKTKPNAIIQIAGERVSSADGTIWFVTSHASIPGMSPGIYHKNTPSGVSPRPGNGQDQWQYHGDGKVQIRLKDIEIVEPLGLVTCTRKAIQRQDYPAILSQNWLRLLQNNSGIDLFADRKERFTLMQADGAVELPAATSSPNFWGMRLEQSEGQRELVIGSRKVSLPGKRSLFVQYIDDRFTIFADGEQVSE